MAEITIEIIQKIEENRVIVKCSICNGSGRRPGKSTDTPCNICTGKGVVLVECSSPLVLCSLCNGSGHRPNYGTDIPCVACKGIGGQPLTGGFEIIT